MDRKKYYKAWREANKEKIKAQNKAYQEANKEKVKAYREANKEKIKAKDKAYYEANKEKIKAKNKAYREANKEEAKTYHKDYYRTNKEKIKEYVKAYSDANKAKIRAYIEANKGSRKKYASKYMKNKRKTNLNFKLKCNIQTRLHEAIKNFKKSDSTMKLVGCSLDDLKKHLENKFTFGMNWKNYGHGWHIDHIMPCARFDLSKEEEQRACFHYTNLQPLWASENIKKSDKI